MAIEPERIMTLNDRPVRDGDRVLYWMQQSQRADDNPSLETAILEANSLNLPVLVCFGLTGDYPEANRRHYRFMLEGLVETRDTLSRRGVQMIIRKGNPPEVALDLARRSATIVCDVGYTRLQRQWRGILAEKAPCRVLAVEGDVVVPTEVASDKAEYAARTIRPKLGRHRDDYLKACPRHRVKRKFPVTDSDRLDLLDIDGLLDDLKVDSTVQPVTAFFKGGAKEAKLHLRRFIRNRLENYETHRNQPQTDDISHMSPYLHFGQISPVFLAMAVRDAGHGSGMDRAAYLEELVVRRELAVNFVTHTPDYDRYTCLPRWARETLAAHTPDVRAHRYDRRTLEAAETHDPYWNAAMVEMRETGFMHNYMRMYWGKKILEWSGSPEAAFETALALNNKYFLDGRDPNSYAGVGWIFGLHDRPWPERAVYGKVRSMAASGLERKCDIRGYVKKVDALSRKGAA
ncbi:MAG: deoxyribodipyrimidine photo-lyase [Desulfobacterales bacterium]